MLLKMSVNDAMLNSNINFIFEREENILRYVFD